MPRQNIRYLQDQVNTARRSVKSMRFPENLGGDGHRNVMRVYINVPAGSSYTGGGGNHGARNPATSDIAVYSRPGSTSISSRLGQNQVRIGTVIDLFMPPELQTSYQSDWSQSELGSAATALLAGRTLAEISNWDKAGAKNMFEAIKNTMGEAFANALAGTVSSLSPVNAEGARKAITQTIANPYVEILFNGIQNRTFSFTFKMVPRNIREQQLINDIVFELEFHQAPELKFSGQSNYWLFPSTFDIQFLNRFGQNPHVFKLSTCALTNLTVNHTPDGQFASHRFGAPVATELTLEFTELEQLTKERIFDLESQARASGIMGYPAGEAPTTMESLVNEGLNIQETLNDIVNDALGSLQEIF